jgi:hypothetical protein
LPGRLAAKGDQEAQWHELDAFNLPPEIKAACILSLGSKRTSILSTQSQARKMEKPKFDGYNIPGGQNAREIYLTLPSTEARRDLLLVMKLGIA